MLTAFESFSLLQNALNKESESESEKVTRSTHFNSQVNQLMEKSGFGWHKQPISVQGELIDVHTC